MIKELGFHLLNPPIMWRNNLRAAYLTFNLVYHSRTKHIDIDFYFVRTESLPRFYMFNYIAAKTRWLISSPSRLGLTGFSFYDRVSVCLTPYSTCGDVLNEARYSSHYDLQGSHLSKFKKHLQYSAATNFILCILFFVIYSATILWAYILYQKTCN